MPLSHGSAPYNIRFESDVVHMTNRSSSTDSAHDAVDMPKAIRLGGNPLWHPVIMGAAMGIALGYAEGLALYVLQCVYATQYVSAPIIWIAPVVNAIIFGLVGFVLSLLTHRIQRISTLEIATFAFVFLMATDAIEIAFPHIIARYAKIILAIGVASAATTKIKDHLDEYFAACRRYLPWLAASLVVTCLVIQGGKWTWETYQTEKLVPVEGSPPNVLLVVMDALRADHVSCYGYSRTTTPVIDAIAESGIRFENSFATSSWTLPSHASLFTGLNATEHGVGPKQEYIPDKLTTLAEQLRDRGYRTGAFPANVFWVTHDRVGQGFIHFEDYFHSAADCFYRTMYGRAIEKFIVQRLGFEDIPARKHASDVNRATLSWIDQHPDRPFFAFVNYFDCHDPYVPPDGFRSKFADHPVGGILNWRVGRANPEMSDRQRQSEIDAYDGGIAYADHQLGELMAALRQRGLDRNTLVVVTSDHGESFCEHGFYLHGHSLYMEQVRIPLIVRAPHPIPSRQVISQPVSIASLPATIMELVGATDHSFANPSLVELWSGQVTSWPYPRAATLKKVWAPPGSPAFHDSLECVITPKWHLIQYRDREPELFDWRADPRETHDLAEPGGVPPIIEDLTHVDWIKNLTIPTDVR